MLNERALNLKFVSPLFERHTNYTSEQAMTGQTRDGLESKATVLVWHRRAVLYCSRTTLCRRGVQQEQQLVSSMAEGWDGRLQTATVRTWTWPAVFLRVQYSGSTVKMLHLPPFL
jgi:hypothetical protein